MIICNFFNKYFKLLKTKMISCYQFFIINIKLNKNDKWYKKLLPNFYYSNPLIAIYILIILGNSVTFMISLTKNII